MTTFTDKLLQIIILMEHKKFEPTNFIKFVKYIKYIKKWGYLILDRVRVLNI